MRPRKANSSLGRLARALSPKPREADEPQLLKSTSRSLSLAALGFGTLRPGMMPLQLMSAKSEVSEFLQWLKHWLVIATLCCSTLPRFGIQAGVMHPMLKSPDLQTATMRL